MTNRSIKKLTLSAMFVAIAIVLPFFTGQIQLIGNMLLPMHIPVMLRDLICGWQYGLTVGFVLPLLRSLLFTMPHLYPNAVAMAFELAAYGVLIGLLYRHSVCKGLLRIYAAMIPAMLGGRIIWGIVMAILLGVGDDGFGFAAFMAGAWGNAIPGIVLQIVLIPAIMTTLEKIGVLKEAGRKEG